MFIESIRRASETWWFRTFLFIFALGISFLWYGRDLISPSRQSQSNIVSVGGEKISLRQFSQALSQELGRFHSRLQQDITPEQQKQLYPYVLETLIRKQLIESEAHRLKLAISDQRIRQMILEDPTFKTDGVFNRKKFDTLLKNINLRESDFTDTLRLDILRSDVLQSLFGGVKVPVTLAQALYHHDHQRRTVEVITLESTLTTLDKEPTLEEIKDYFQKNPAAFVAPEYRDITALVLNAASFPLPEISEDQLHKAHEGSEFSSRPFEEVKEQLRGDLQKSVLNEKLFELTQKIEDAVAGGASLSEIAKLYNLKVKTFKAINAKGEQKESLDAPGIVASVLSDSLEAKIVEEAFKEKQGETSKVMDQGDGQSFLFQVDHIYPAYPKTFEESQAQAKALVIQDLKKHKTQALVLEIEQQVNKGTPLSLLAGQKGLKTARLRLGRKGPLVPSPFYLPENFVGLMFQLPLNKAKAASYLTETNQQNFIIGAVSQIENGQKALEPEVLKETQKSLQQDIFNDLYSQYVEALKTRFPVEYNQKVVDQLFKQ